VTFLTSDYDIALHVSKLLKRRTITLTALAFFTDLDADHLHDLIYGFSPWSELEAERVADAFGLDSADLGSGAGL
jgi:hypothetical protein